LGKERMFSYSPRELAFSSAMQRRQGGRAATEIMQML
jgi:hypothetical protein